MDTVADGHPSAPADGTVRGVALALLAQRAAGATVCPSEVARALAAKAGADWRLFMPVVHGAIDGLVAEGVVRLTWQGVPLAARDGPYRIGRVAERMSDADPARRPQDV